MSGSANLSKGPGVRIPPPILYVAAFLVARFLQGRWPLPPLPQKGMPIRAAGIVLAMAASVFLVRSLGQFLRTRNTVVLIKRARSLQTDGIYRLSRNPMYVGLGLVYLAVACFAGNWWTLIAFPFLLLLVQEAVIKREERYLAAEFGDGYAAYKQRTRRWL